MGSTQLAMDSIVFDTGSSWYVLNSIDDINCTGAYNYTNSTTYQVVTPEVSFS